MKKKFTLGFGIFLSVLSITKAQRHEIGVVVGAPNIVGDIGRTNYFLPGSGSPRKLGIPVYAGANYRMNFNPQQTVRLDVNYSHVNYDDAAAAEEYRYNRGNYGENTLWSAAVMFEYQFFGINNEQPYGFFSPYIFAGIGGVMYRAPQIEFFHDFTRDANGVAQAPMSEQDFVTTPSYSRTDKIAPFIPVGVGVKYKFNYQWTISLEATVRATFTDQLDNNMLRPEDVKNSFSTDIVSPATGASLLQTPVYFNQALTREAEFIRQRNVGDLKNKDWLNTITLGISYSFGRPPCFCD